MVVGGGGTADNAKQPMALGEGGDKCRQMGNKCNMMRGGAIMGDNDKPECSGRQLWETSGRQV